MSSAPGVWLEGSDGTDINALCRSHNERMVAVADDFCKVHLFHYPCPKPKVGLTCIVFFLPLLPLLLLVNLLVDCLYVKNRKFSLSGSVA